MSSEAHNHDVMTDQTAPARTNPILSEVQALASSNILLTLLFTGLGYVVACMYQVGQFTVYGLPLFLVDISPTALIVGISVTFVVGLSLLINFLTYLDSIKKWKHRWLRRLAYVGFSVVGLLGVFYVLDLLYFKLMMLVIGIAGGTLLLALAIVVVAYWIQEKSLSKALNRFRNGKEEPRSASLHLIPNRFKVFYILAIPILALAYVIGGFQARSASSFPLLVSVGDKNEVIVLVRGDDAYTKIYDSESKKFEDGFKKVDFPQDKMIETFYKNPESKANQEFWKQ